MSKKNRSKRLQKRLVVPLSRLLEKQIDHAQFQIQQGDFEGTISTCEPLLSQLPRRAPLRIHVLAMLGLAHGMLQDYQKSYDLFSEALSIDPTNADLWYNRGLACRYTTRVGQAARDFERAVELAGNDKGELTRKYAHELKVSRKDLQKAMLELKEEISLDQFLEQEQRFVQAMGLMKLSKWKEAELAFRQIIEIGGRLPQYWGNVGVSLIMQLRYEEAEDALKRALEIDPEYTIARNNLEKLPDVRQAGGPLGIEVREIVPKKDLKQSIAFYKPRKDNSPTTVHTRIEKIGNTVKSTRKQLGKQAPSYRFFLNPYQDVRFTRCPQCRNKTLQRKFPLVIHIDPVHTLILGKTCRYCPNCDLLIAHQDQLEVELAGHFETINPEIIGNDYLVMGTLDQPEWKQGLQEPLSTQEMIEHLHDFKEVLTFKPAYL